MLPINITELMEQNRIEYKKGGSLWTFNIKKENWMKKQLVGNSDRFDNFRLQSFFNV